MFEIYFLFFIKW